jgi:hypothetical protein
MARSSTHRSRHGVSRVATIEAWGVVAAIIVTVFLVQTGVLHSLIEAANGLGQFSGLLAGVLYALFITTPLAIGAFIELAHIAPVWQIALWGALGASVIDYLLARSTRSPLVSEIMDGTFGKGNIKSFGKRATEGPFKWFVAILGAVLIAIPVPTDEEGIALLGVAHFSGWQLMLLMFAANFCGIYFIVAIASRFTA